MQPEHIHNHLRLCLSSRRFYELTEMLGMQPELLCPRRSRFAPMCKLRLQLIAQSCKLKAGSSELVCGGVCKRADLAIK